MEMYMRKAKLTQAVTWITLCCMLLIVSSNTISHTSQAEESEVAERLSSSAAKKVIAVRAREVMWALRNKNMLQLSAFVHPEKGMRFSPYAYVDGRKDLTFSGKSVRNLLSNKRQYTWGNYDGSGDPIRLSFAQYYARFVYNRDFYRAREVGYNRMIGKGNSTNNITETYPEAITVEYYILGTRRHQGMDWASLRLIFEEKNGAWYLVGIGHDEWTI